MSDNQSHSRQAARFSFAPLSPSAASAQPAGTPRFTFCARVALLRAQHSLVAHRHLRLGPEHMLAGIVETIPHTPALAAAFAHISGWLSVVGATQALLSEAENCDAQPSRDTLKGVEIVAVIAMRGILFNELLAQLSGDSLSSELKRALLVAETDARNMHLDQIGPGHLLLGIAHGQYGRAAEVLRVCNISYAHLRASLLPQAYTC